jgi:ribosomal protein L11 methyltransferase
MSGGVTSLTLETLTLDGLPEHAVPAFEAALESVCRSVAFFRDEATDTWRLEALREPREKEAELQAALALAAALVGIAPPALVRAAVETQGWLARTIEAFPEQVIGRTLLIRPTHVPPRRVWGRVVITMDAGLAFGTGEHGSTRGCLLAFEAVAHRRPRRIIDLGAGSGILGLTAAARLKRRVWLTDIEPWSVRVAEQNARMNALPARAIVADGWRNRRLRAKRFDLIFANILARPLCAMAHGLALHLAPGGTAILAGLLGTQARMVLAAHRAQGLVLERRLDLGAWTTLTLRRRA